MTDKKEHGNLSQQILNTVGILLCVILIPILIINCTLLIKGMVNKDEVPSFCSVIPLIVLTDSMNDEFPSGSIIFSKDVDAKEIDEGDIISYFDPASKTGAVVTHKVRFIETEDSGLVFYTYGTANTDKAFAEVEKADCEKIPAENLVGSYTGVRLKGLGNVAIFMQSTPGLIVCVIVPLLLIIGYDVIRRKIYDAKQSADKDELLRELEELRRLKAEKDDNSSEGSE